MYGEYIFRHLAIQFSVWKKSFQDIRIKAIRISWDRKAGNKFNPLWIVKVLVFLIMFLIGIILNPVCPGLLVPDGLHLFHAGLSQPL